MSNHTGRRAKSAIGAALLGAGLAAVAIGAVGLPVAKADDTDDRYIQLLNYEGIGHRAPRDKLIELGHDICDDLSNGESPHEVLMGLYQSAGLANLSEHDADALVEGAIGAYCPQYNPD
ncbi:MAG: DUF732 domain-containing protein [Mycobacterium sp.]